MQFKPKENLVLVAVEDNDSDFEALTHSLVKAGITNSIVRFASGDEALDYLTNLDHTPKARKPHLIFLDLNLPGIDGRSVLEVIKKDENLKSIPVLILTSSPLQPDIESAYKAGANTYFIKPDSLNDLEKLVDNIKRYWMGEYVV